MNESLLQLEAVLFFLYDVSDGPRVVSIFSPRSGRRIAHRDVMECTSEGNPHPAYYWTASLSDFITNTTSTGAELIVDVCNLTGWSQTSEKRNVSGTTRLTLICHAQNTVRGQIRTVSARQVYNLSLPSNSNMDEVCSGGFIL